MENSDKLLLGGIVLATVLLWRSGILGTSWRGLGEINKGLNYLSSGEIGTNLGNSYYGKVLSGNTSSIQTVNPNYGAGIQTRADVIFNTPTVPVTETDAAFSNLGLTTSQVIWIQNNYPNLFMSINQKLSSSNVSALTTQELSALMAAGWTGLPAQASGLNPNAYKAILPNTPIVSGANNFYGNI